jgi:hypothetical protein
MVAANASHEALRAQVTDSGKLGFYFSFHLARNFFQSQFTQLKNLIRLEEI